MSLLENFSFSNSTRTLAQVVDITGFNLFLYNVHTNETRDWIFTNGAISANQAFGAAPASWKMFATGDFNMDGIGDVIWRDSSTGDTREWLLNGTGGLTSNTSLGSLGQEWRILATGDFSWEWRAMSRGKIEW